MYANLKISSAKNSQNSLVFTYQNEGYGVNAHGIINHITQGKNKYVVKEQGVYSCSAILIFFCYFRLKLHILK